MALDIQDQRTLAEKANHYLSDYTKGRKYYEVNHWRAIYTRIHPKFTDPVSPQRTLCVKVLNIALNWHLENELNENQRREIKRALQEIFHYAS